MPFNEHVYKLCLDYCLYSATIRLQANMGLGKAFAGMLPFVEGLHTLGYIDDAVYELYRNKYSVTLEEANSRKNKSPVQIAKEQSRENYCRSSNKVFGNVLNQWVTMKPRNKAYWIKKAKLPKHVNPIEYSMLKHWYI